MIFSILYLQSQKFCEITISQNTTNCKYPLLSPIQNRKHYNIIFNFMYRDLNHPDNQKSLYKYHLISHAPNPTFIFYQSSSTTIRNSNYSCNVSLTIWSNTTHSINIYQFLSCDDRYHLDMCIIYQWLTVYKCVSPSSMYLTNHPLFFSILFLKTLYLFIICLDDVQ